MTLLTVLSTPPSTTDPTNFDARGDQLLTVELPRLVTELNVVSVEVGAHALAALNSASLAATNGAEQVLLAGAQVALAATQAVNAARSALAALAVANYKGTWASLSGALNTPACVAHEGDFWILTSSLPDVGASTPGPTNPAWLRVAGATGAPGAQGQTGTAGQTGAQGQTGAAGQTSMDATTLALIYAGL